MMRATQHTGSLPRRRPAVGALLAGAALLLGLAACDGARDSHLLSPDGVGTVEGVAYLDLNRQGVRAAGEGPIAGLRIALVVRGTQDESASTISGAEGEFLFQDVPAGSYRVEVSGDPMGDSLQVTGLAPNPVEVTAGRTASVQVGLSFPAFTPTQLPSVSHGSRVYVEGIALNRRGYLPEQAVHVWDGSRAARVEEVAAFTMSEGDSVRLLGRAERRGDRVVLRDAIGYRLEERPEPAPVSVSTSEAASARQGELDAALVRISGATVSDVRESSGSRRVTASDGSGAVHVRLPTSHLAEAGVPALHPGARLAVTGILMSAEGGGWELRTRSGADLAVDAAGTIEGRTFYDADGSGSFGSGEEGMAGVRLRLYRDGDQATPVATIHSASDGRFRVDSVPVGSYRLEVDPSTIPDTLEVLRVDPELIDVPTNDAVQVQVAITHPLLTVAEARQAPAGRTVFVEGVALNARGAFGNNSVHLRAPGGELAIRALGLSPPNVTAGHRVRLRARTGQSLGQPVLTQSTPWVVGTAGTPSAVVLSSAEAASARSGDLDAELARVIEAQIESSQGGAATWTLRVDDGSGSVEAQIRLESVGMTAEQAASAFEPGERVTLTGVLIPTAAGSGIWRIHPRSRSDIVVDP